MARNDLQTPPLYQHHLYYLTNGEHTGGSLSLHPLSLAKLSYLRLSWHLLLPWTRGSQQHGHKQSGAGQGREAVPTPPLFFSNR